MWLQDAVWAVRPKMMFYFGRTFVLCMLTLNMKNETEYLKNGFIRISVTISTKILNLWIIAEFSWTDLRVLNSAKWSTKANIVMELPLTYCILGSHFHAGATCVSVEVVPCGQPHAPGLVDSLVGNPGGRQGRDHRAHMKVRMTGWKIGGKCAKLGDKSWWWYTANLVKIL